MYKKRGMNLHEYIFQLRRRVIHHLCLLLLLLMMTNNRSQSIKRTGYRRGRDIHNAFLQACFGVIVTVNPVYRMMRASA